MSASLFTPYTPRPLPGCPEWCNQHITGSLGGPDVHQWRVAVAGGLQVEVWRTDDGPIHVGLLDADNLELGEIQPSDVRALAGVLGTAAVIVSGEPGTHRLRQV